MPSSELPGADFHASPLPDSSSPTLALVRATPAEVRKTWEANGPFWRGPLSLAQFFQREQHLLSQSLTRNGGMTHWILVDNAQASQGQDRRILCACETIRKKALVAYADGRVEDVISHGIGSVFCDPRFRRRGYAARMMKELAAILRGWQSNQGNCLFTELYSDIGKEFYAPHGWHPFPSSHVSLEPYPCRNNSMLCDYRVTLPNKIPDRIQQAAHRVGNVQVTQLSSSSLKELCMADETLLRRKMAFVQRSDNLRVALIPDLETFNWHHAREEFFADKLFGHRADSRGRLEPFNKGVLVTNSSTNKRAWCVWSHSWRSSKEDGILYILRLVLEEEATWDLAGASEDEKAEKISLMAKLLQSAQEEAGLWGMRAVQLWNPTPTQEALISLARPDAITFEREKDSIPCLMWYGEASQNNIEWIGNEKFAWC